MQNLKYTSESDRCYGAAGMAISLVVYDGEDVLAGFSLDESPETETISLTPDFFFAGNPGVSARTAWRQMLKNFNLGVAMATGNLMCRCLVSRHTGVPAEMRRALHDIVTGEGADSCQLDTDESEALFDKTFGYLERVFSHRGVQSVAHDFASALQSRRTLSRLDALELLAALRML